MSVGTAVGKSIDAIFSRLSSMASSFRRRITGYPTRASMQAHINWLREQVKVYATLQPYASPLTTPDGGLSSGETWEMRRGYREMVFREPAVKAALMGKCLAVAQLKPVMRAANKARPLDRQAAKWVDHTVSRSVGGWCGLITNMLIPGLVDGYSVNEKVFLDPSPTDPDYPNFWGLKQAKSKDTEHIRFRLDQFRNILSVQAMAAGQGAQPFDPGDFIIFSHLKVFENPFGVSDLRAANRAANLIEASIKLRAILLENFSGPFLVGRADSAGDRILMMRELAKARACGYIVLGSNSEFDVVNLATSAPDQFQSTIDDLRKEIATAIQGAYLQLQEGSVPDGRGSTEVSQSIAQLFQWWLAQCVCDCLNHQLIPDLVRPNYGESVGMPMLQLGGKDSETIIKALERFKVVRNELGLPLSVEQVYDEAQIENPDSEADTLWAPASAQGVRPPLTLPQSSPAA